MKLGDGGSRPAFYVQFSTTTDEACVIVGVDDVLASATLFALTYDSLRLSSLGA